MPASRPETGNVADALLSVAVASSVVPSRSVTVPVGAGAPCPCATDTVSEALPPTPTCVAEETSVVVLDAFATASATAAEEDAEKFASPSYAAVMLWLPLLSWHSGAWRRRRTTARTPRRWWRS